MTIKLILSSHFLYQNTRRRFY